MVADGSGGGALPRWFEVYPELRNVEVRAEEMTSPEFFARERDLVFRRIWLYAGQAQDLQEAGAFFVRDFPAFNASILLVRGQDGTVRGFHNVCRHRCNKLVRDSAAGRARTFVCDYHGWTYDPQGKLIGMPDPDGYLQQEKLGLIPVATETWNGFIFINLEPKPRQTLKEFLGDAYDGPLSQYDFNQPRESWTWRTEVKANWKVVLDLFSESYHVRFVHQHSVRRLYSDPNNPFSHQPVIRINGLHRVSSVFGSLQQKIGPIGQLTLKHGGGTLSRYRNEEVVRNAVPGTNPAKLANWGFDTHYIFPNHQITIFGGFWHYHSFQPLAHDRMMWEHRIFFPKAESAGTRFAQEFSRSLQQIVASEDAAVAEANQEGLATGAVPFLTLHEQEVRIGHTRKMLAEYMAG
jgi:phenylpropionate dioxygenase-like ring-hydroxylating dioxygenase large terminal subunit